MIEPREGRKKPIKCCHSEPSAATARTREESAFVLPETLELGAESLELGAGTENCELGTRHHKAA